MILDDDKILEAYNTDVEKEDEKLVQKYTDLQANGENVRKIIKSGVGTQDILSVEDLDGTESAETQGTALANTAMTTIANNTVGQAGIQWGLSTNNLNSDINVIDSAVKNTWNDFTKKKEETNYTKKANHKVLEGLYATTTNLLSKSMSLMAGSLGLNSSAAWSSDLLSSLNLKKEQLTEDFFNSDLDKYFASEQWGLDSDEISNLLTTSFSTLMINKPGIKVGIKGGASHRNINLKKKISEIRDYLKERNDNVRTLGMIYVEPFYNEGKFEHFTIPFEFNPNIAEGTLSAKYNEINLMNRVISARQYIGTNAGNLTVETTYLALTEDGSDKLKNTGNNIEGSWMYDWTLDQIEKVELQLRSLVMPNVANGKFVVPPIVQVRMASEDNVYSLYNEDRSYLSNDDGDNFSGDLFKYPKNSIKDPYLKTTRNESDLDAANSRYKRYIVTDVNITPLESYGNAFTMPYIDDDKIRHSYYRRKGFKVTLTMSETTRNFLDLVPDYSAYYNAWTNIETENKQNPVNTGKSESVVSSMDTINYLNDMWNNLKEFAKIYYTNKDVINGSLFIDNVSDSIDYFYNNSGDVKLADKAINEIELDNFVNNLLDEENNISISDYKKYIEKINSNIKLIKNLKKTDNIKIYSNNDHIDSGYMVIYPLFSTSNIENSISGLEKYYYDYAVKSYLGLNNLKNYYSIDNNGVYYLNKPVVLNKLNYTSNKYPSVSDMLAYYSLRNILNNGENTTPLLNKVNTDTNFIYEVEFGLGEEKKIEKVDVMTNYIEYNEGHLEKKSRGSNRLDFSKLSDEYTYKCMTVSQRTDYNKQLENIENIDSSLTSLYSSAKKKIFPTDTSSKYKKQLEEYFTKSYQDYSSALKLYKTNISDGGEKEYFSSNSTNESNIFKNTSGFILVSDNFFNKETNTADETKDTVENDLSNIESKKLLKTVPDNFPSLIYKVFSDNHISDGVCDYDDEYFNFVNQAFLIDDSLDKKTKIDEKCGFPCSPFNIANLDGKTEISFKDSDYINFSILSEKLDTIDGEGRMRDSFSYALSSKELKSLKKANESKKKEEAKTEKKKEKEEAKAKKDAAKANRKAVAKNKASAMFSKITS